MSKPWGDWYHCTTHTYGTWLRGDPRGWRARHHREHVDGDYRNPPPKGKYDALFAQSKSLLTHDPVKIRRDLCQFVLDHVVERLLERGNDVRTGCFDGVHLHTLQRNVKHNPKIELGSAKQFATAQLKARGFAPVDLQLGQGIWQTGSHAEPIASEYHFRKATDYIQDHLDRGAAVWVSQPIQVR